MIGIVDVEVQAANPSMPLHPLRAYINSPSSLRIRNVPKKIGTWQITSVQLVAAYPDNSIRTANCVLVGGVWVGTIQGSTATGASENGYTVFASGRDENGNEVNGYVLGKGLVEILETDGTITPGQDTSYVHLLDNEPEEPKEGDMYPVPDGYVLWADGKANLLKGMTEQEAGNFDSLHIQVDDLYRDVILLGGLIPPQASSSNQLADKAFVNSSVQTATANFRGNWATWNDVPDQSEYYPVDYAGSKTPTVNDYLVVQDASGYVGTETLEGTWRFKYSGTWSADGKQGWLPEYQVNETPMTAAQLAAINSNITAAKVAQYDNALIDTNYVFHTASPDSQHPTLPTSAFPVVVETSDGETLTFNDMTGLYMGTDGYTLYLNNTTGDSYAEFAPDGTFIGNGSGAAEITFGGQATTTLTFPYMLQDRAVNSISISADTSMITVEFPAAIANHARDFMIRFVASAGTYGTTPTLSISGVTLMNADGEMPEIKTDTTNACTTLVYFSEIASNVFLCKGEQMEAITL